MNMKALWSLAAMAVLLLPLPAVAADTVATMLAGYEATGAGPFDAARGQRMWTQEHVDAKRGGRVSCATCHHADLTRAGAHHRTGKLIEPMSPRITPTRLSDPDKVEKWFRRNCKATLGRACTPQEKGDFLMFIQSQ